MADILYLFVVFWKVAVCDDHSSFVVSKVLFILLIFNTVFPRSGFIHWKIARNWLTHWICCPSYILLVLSPKKRVERKEFKKRPKQIWPKHQCEVGDDEKERESVIAWGCLLPLFYNCLHNLMCKSRTLVLPSTFHPPTVCSSFNDILLNFITVVCNSSKIHVKKQKYGNSNSFNCILITTVLLLYYLTTMGYYFTIKNDFCGVFSFLITDVFFFFGDLKLHIYPMIIFLMKKSTTVILGYW